MKEKLYLFNRGLYQFLDNKIFYVKTINILFLIQTLVIFLLVIAITNDNYYKELLHGSFSILFITSLIVITYHISECIDSKYGMQELMRKSYSEKKCILKNYKQLKKSFEEIESDRER